MCVLVSQLCPTHCKPTDYSPSGSPVRAILQARTLEQVLPCPPPGIFLTQGCGLAGKQSACKDGDLGSIPGLGRPPGEWNSYPLQYSGLENAMDCIVHELAKSWTQLSDFHSCIGGGFFII